MHDQHICKRTQIDSLTNRIQKLSFVLLFLLLFHAGASAAIFKATLEGTVEIGTDIQGVFGIPGTNSYSGIAFIATWTIDTSLVSDADRCDNIAEYGCYGALGTGQVATPFIKDISLTINGITKKWPNPDQATQILRVTNDQEGLDEYEMISNFSHESGYSTYTRAYIADDTGTMLSSTMLSQIAGPIDINLPFGAFHNPAGLSGLEFHLPVPCTIDEDHCTSTNHDLLLIISEPWLFNRFSVIALPEPKHVPIPLFAILMLSISLVSFGCKLYLRLEV